MFTSRQAATVFFTCICLYVFCIIGIEVNWSGVINNYASNIKSTQHDQCSNDECSYIDSSYAETFNDMTRSIISRIGLSSDPQDECFLRDKLEKTGMPILHSVFVDSITREVIFNGVLRGYFDSYDSDLFECEFQVDEYEYIVTMTDPILRDFRRFGDETQYSVIITCPLPEQMFGRPQFKMALSRASNTSFRYDDITVCQTATNETSTYFLTMCTMTKNMDKSIPDWLAYHKFLGVQHVFIYDNSDKTTLPRTTRHYVEKGFLTIIPWAHQHSSNKTYLEVQIASENDCMWRNRHTSHWIIKIDVDEFLQPMDPTRPKIPQYLRDRRFQIDKLGSLRIQNWFFCPHDNKAAARAHLRSLKPRSWSVFERNFLREREPTLVNRGRDKAIIRPNNIHYYKIHGIKLGGDTLTLSPTTELRLVHYRGDSRRHIGFCPSHRLVFDVSMITLWYQLHRANMNRLNNDLKRMKDELTSKV